MVSRKIIVHTPNGLQLRPAGELAEYALRFRSRIMLSSGDKEISAKSLLGVLSLGIRQNTEIRITCDGSDEDEAICGITDFIDHLGNASVSGM